MKPVYLIFLIVLFAASACGDKGKSGSGPAASDGGRTPDQQNDMNAFLAVNKLLKDVPADQYPEYAGVLGDKKYEWYYIHSSQAGTPSEFERKRQIEALKPEVDEEIASFNVSSPVLFYSLAETDGKYDFEKKGYKTPIPPSLLTNPPINLAESPEIFIPMTEGDAEDFEKKAKYGFMGFSLSYDLYVLITAQADASGKKVITSKLQKVVCKAGGDGKVLVEKSY